MVSGFNESKIGQKLNISDEQLRKYNRFNIEWHIQQQIDKLFDTEQPFDYILASVLVDILSVIYFFKKIKWWIKEKSSISWIWWQINKMGVLLRLRSPIKYEYEYEFCHWGPPNCLDDMDFDDIL
jgi:hypothetical protein